MNEFVISNKTYGLVYEKMPHEAKIRMGILVSLFMNAGVPQEDAQKIIVCLPMLSSILSSKGFSHEEILEFWKDGIRGKLCGDNAFYLFQEFVLRLNDDKFDRGCLVWI